MIIDQQNDKENNSRQISSLKEPQHNLSIRMDSIGSADATPYFQLDPEFTVVNE